TWLPNVSVTSPATIETPNPKANRIAGAPSFTLRSCAPAEVIRPVNASASSCASRAACVIGDYRAHNRAAYDPAITNHTTIAATEPRNAPQRSTASLAQPQYTIRPAAPPIIPSDCARAEADPLVTT